MKEFAIILGAFMAIVAIGIGVFFIRVALLPARVAENTITTTEGVIDQTLTADNAIYNYEWFKQQYEDIQAIEKKIVIAEEKVISFEESAGPRSEWTFEDKNEHARLSSVQQGLESQYEDAVATYNARSQMANRNIFKDGLIPQTIEIGSGLLK